MEQNNYMKIDFLAKSENESFARSVVSAFAAQLDPTLEELADIRTAVSEAVTNAIIHGYGEQEGFVHIECVIKGQEIQVKISDHGRGIQNVEKAMEPLFTTSPETERSGMGFTVMGTFMDSLKVESQVEVGTQVFMTKCIQA